MLTTVQLRTTQVMVEEHNCTNYGLNMCDEEAVKKINQLRSGTFAKQVFKTTYLIIDK